MFDKLKKAFQGFAPSINVAAACDGEAVALSQVSDPTFAEEMLGPGQAIKPSADLLCSPIKGIVTSLFPTLHAVTLKSEEGLEILIHLGLDTVNLKGDGFTALIEANSKVDVGTPLIKFDRQTIEAAGYDLITPIIICNADNFEIIKRYTGAVKIGDSLLEIRKNS